MRLSSLIMLVSLISTSAVAAPATTCGQPGHWLVPATGPAQPIEPGALLARMARQQVVLLGEAHDSAEDHRWQSQTLAQLHAYQARLAIGFEMFPRRVQPVLDEWVAGKLSESEFLQRGEWEKVWGFDARDYLPLFHFARMNRLPMLALNVERSLIEAVGKQGWDAVPVAQKEGVGRPAEPTDAYRKELRAVFEHHPMKDRDKGESEIALARFIESQTLWDRAMAQVMAEHLRKHPDVMVVGIMGAGHVRRGHGVAHQLKDLTIANVGILLTRDRDEDCTALGKSYADAIYLVDPPKDNPPRLGVSTDQTAEGLRITAVTPGSVAEAAGLKVGDLIVEVAGQPARNILTLRTAVQRQTPGTWLPMKVRRDAAEIEIVARFPAAS
jgi:uncharacterized iron-regulated protein